MTTCDSANKQKLTLEVIDRSRCVCWARTGYVRVVSAAAEGPTVRQNEVPARLGRLRSRR